MTSGPETRSPFARFFYSVLSRPLDERVKIRAEKHYHKLYSCCQQMENYISVPVEAKVKTL